jgi:hypothetical protein
MVVINSNEQESRGFLWISKESKIRAAMKAYITTTTSSGTTGVLST